MNNCHEVASTAENNNDPNSLTHSIENKRFQVILTKDNVSDNQVWCVCGMPDEYGDMICCGRCEQCFHEVCVGAEMSMDMSWKCTICKE